MKKDLEGYTVTPMGVWKADIEIKVSVIVMKENGFYDCYIRDEHTPYKFMFGLPVQQQSRSEAMAMAVANIPDYLKLLDDEEV